MINKKGYSFLEMLFVVIIIAIIATLSFKGIQYFYYETEDRVLKKQLLNIINYAQSEANATHSAIIICQTSDDANCRNMQQKIWTNKQIVFNDIYRDGAVHYNAQILSIMHTAFTHGKVFWHAYPRHRKDWQFYPSDWLMTDNAALWHCHGKQLMWTILVNQSGNAHVVDGSQLRQQYHCNS